MTVPADLRFLARYPVDFEPGDAEGQARFVFRAPPGHDDMRVTPVDALTVLTYASRDPASHASVVAWSGAAIVAVRMLARGTTAHTSSLDMAQLQSAAYALPYPAETSRTYLDTFLRALGSLAPGPRSDPKAKARQELYDRLARHQVTQPPIPIGLHIEFAENSDGTVAHATVWLHPEGPTQPVATAHQVWNDPDHALIGRRIEVTGRLERLGLVWPTALRLVDNLALGPTRLDITELSELSSATVVAGLAETNIATYWPREVVRTLESQAVVRAKATTSSREAIFGGGQIFEFDWRLGIGGVALGNDELDDLIRANHALVRLRDEWVLVDPATIADARLRPAFTLPPGQAIEALVSGTVVVDEISYEFQTEGWLDDLRVRLAGRDEASPVPQPAALAGRLRDYQLEGFRWLHRMTDLGLGVCLADDMGLGKTIMLIALHLQRNDADQQTPTLVVCPTSVLGNWEREIRRFAPGVPVHRFHGNRRSLDAATSGFVLTTYGTMRADAGTLAAHSPGWGLVAADEAQQIKNPHASTARAMRTIPAGARVALTGTPVENNLTELWSILTWATPGLLGTLEDFRDRWARQIERYGDTDRARELAAVIAPFVLRRRKSDPGIAPELPAKTETDLRVPMTREQVGLYETVVREALATIARAKGIERRGLIIKLLTQCKQICNHPAQFLHEHDGQIPWRSGKIPALDGLLDTIISEDGAALVFTQYVQMGELLVRHLTERGMPHLFLHGGTTVLQREKMVDRFQAGEVPVFILSLKAAGVGLNLTRADHVIHFDRWWNPAVEDQATDRAYRIGQTRPVQVHRLITEGTVEETIAVLIAAKRDLADAVVNGGDGTLTELTDADLADLVRLRRTPLD
ncbi:DEAD/DEAH box helicase [soil metagenome]